MKRRTTRERMTRERMTKMTRWRKEMKARGKVQKCPNLIGLMTCSFLTQVFTSHRLFSPPLYSFLPLSPSPLPLSLPFPSSQHYFAESRTWATLTTTGTKPSPRCAAGVCALDDKHIFLFGGRDAHQRKNDSYVLNLGM